jgi:hypothetical protein
MTDLNELEPCDWIDWDEGRDFPAPDQGQDDRDEEHIATRSTQRW